MSNTLAYVALVLMLALEACVWTFATAEDRRFTLETSSRVAMVFTIGFMALTLTNYPFNTPPTMGNALIIGMFVLNGLFWIISGITLYDRRQRASQRSPRYSDKYKYSSSN